MPTVLRHDGAPDGGNPINGKLYVVQRFAIDYVQLSDDFRLFTGVPTKLESYPYFGAPVPRRVGDGKGGLGGRRSTRNRFPTKVAHRVAAGPVRWNHVVRMSATAITLWRTCNPAASRSKTRR